MSQFLVGLASVVVIAFGIYRASVWAIDALAEAIGETTGRGE